MGVPKAVETPSHGDVPGRTSTSTHDDNFVYYGDYSVDLSVPPLGNGRNGDVFLGVHVKNGQRVAIKTVQVKNKAKDRLATEIKLLRMLRHPNIVRLIDVIEGDVETVVITELVTGGELFSRIRESIGGRIPEKEMRYYFRQILDGVEYCHQHGVSHRDLKPENILLDKKRKNVKLIDFGFGKMAEPNQDMKTRCGSPHYMPPEIAQGKQYDGQLVDIWCLGITLYVCLCGCYPFEGKNYQELYADICNGDLMFPQTANLTPEVKDLVTRMLAKDAKQRLSIPEIRQHPWFVKKERQPLSASFEKLTSRKSDSKCTIC
eukprot:Colp12_sorted_trinity150504_noHs@28014